jgi:hypothetical protein
MEALMDGSPGRRLTQKLRKLYQESPENGRIFDFLAARKLDRQDTSVERAASETKLENSVIVSLFRALAEAGAGDFKVGRHGRKTRIEWYYSLRSIGKIASGHEIDLAPVPAGTTTEEAAEGLPEDVKMADHAFVVRHGLTIKFQLPIDLTKKEADRLANTIRNIPFDE